MRNIRSRWRTPSTPQSRTRHKWTLVVEALEAGNVKNAMCLLKQVSNNLGATRDMLNDRMLFLNINADP